jgi:glutamine synthetase
MPQTTGDPHAEEQWERLPTSIDGAIDNFDTAFTRSVFGDTFVENFTIMQRREFDEFTANAEQGDDVSEWELKRYRAVI